MDFKVADLSLAGFGRKEIALAEHEMPGLMALRERVRRRPAARRRPHRRLAAHDRADRRPHRDADRARRRRPLGLLQHLLHPGPRRRGDRRRRRHPRGARRRPGLRLEGRDAARSTGGAPSGSFELARAATSSARTCSWTTAATPPCWCTSAPASRPTAPSPTPPTPTPRSTGHPRDAARHARRGPGQLDPHRPGHQGRHRGDHHRRHRLYELARDGRCSSRRSTSTTRSPRASSTTSTAAGTR